MLLLEKRETFKYTKYYNAHMGTISVRVEDELVEDLAEVEKTWQADRSEVVRRLLVKSLQEWKVEQALEKLRSHTISLGRAAEECGLSLWDMLELAKQKNIGWTNYSADDLEHDLALLKR